MNRAPQEIFAPENLSTRCKLYQKDQSVRGRALYLSQMLAMLKAEFPDFKFVLDCAITKIRSCSLATDEDHQEKILRAMRSFATTVEEIAEDSELSNEQVRIQLKHLKAAGKIRQHNHPIGETYRDQLWFEVCTTTGCKNPSHIHQQAPV